MAIIFTPQVGQGQDSTQFSSIIVLRESDYSIIELFKESDQTLGAKVKILNPIIDSRLSETGSPISLVFQSGEESYMTIGFCIISSFLPPTKCYYYLMDTQWRPIRETDGSFIFLSPFESQDTQMDDSRWKIIKLQKDDYVVLFDEKYTNCTGLQIRILNPETRSILMNNERPIISIQYNGDWINARPRELLNPPQGAFYSVDSTGRAILSGDGMMEIILL